MNERHFRDGVRGAFREKYLMPEDKEVKMAPTFLALVTEKMLQRWGIRSRFAQGDHEYLTYVR